MCTKGSRDYCNVNWRSWQKVTQYSFLLKKRKKLCIRELFSLFLLCVLINLLTTDSLLVLYIFALLAANSELQSILTSLGDYLHFAFCEFKCLCSFSVAYGKPWEWKCLNVKIDFKLYQNVNFALYYIIEWKTSTALLVNILNFFARIYWKCITLKKIIGSFLNCTTQHIVPRCKHFENEAKWSFVQLSRNCL